jgi:hypothetical protein
MKIKASLILTSMLCGTAMLLLPLWDQSIIYRDYWIAVQIIGSFLCISSLGMGCMIVYDLPLQGDKINRENFIGHRE